MEKSEEEKRKDNIELKESVQDLLDLQAKYYMKIDKYNKHISSINKILGVEDTPVHNLINKSDFYKQFSHNEMNVINYARKILDLNIKDEITVVFGRKEYYTLRILLEIIDELLERQFNNKELANQVNTLQHFLNSESDRCSELVILNYNLKENIRQYLDLLPDDIKTKYKPSEDLTTLLNK